MGFFSYKCSKSNTPIPAFPDAELPKEASMVVLVTPKNRKVEGLYDGYGHIGDRDLFAELAQDLYGKYDRELVFSGVKFLMVKGKVFAEVNKFNYNEPIEKKDLVAAANKEIEAIVIGSTLNELQGEGAEISTIYDAVEKMVKIVRKDHYSGESYTELSPSERDPDQGFFYDEKVKKKIFLSLMTKQDFKKSSKSDSKKSRTNPKTKTSFPAFYSLSEISEEYCEFPRDFKNLSVGTIISIIKASSIEEAIKGKKIIAKGAFQTIARVPSAMVVSSKKTIPAGDVYISAEGVRGIAKAYVHLSQTGDIVLGSMATELIK